MEVPIEISFAIILASDRPEQLRLISRSFHQVLSDKLIWSIKLREFKLDDVYDHPISIYHLHRSLTRSGVHGGSHHEQIACPRDSLTCDEGWRALIPQRISIRLRLDPSVNDTIVYFSHMIAAGVIEYSHVIVAVTRQDNTTYRALLRDFNPRSKEIIDCLPCCILTYSLMILIEDDNPLEDYIKIYEGGEWRVSPCTHCCYRRTRLIHELIERNDQISDDIVAHNRFNNKSKLLIIACKHGMSRYVKKIMAAPDACGITKRLKLNVSKFVEVNDMETLRFIRANGYTIKRPIIAQTTLETTKSYVLTWHRNKVHW